MFGTRQESREHSYHSSGLLVDPGQQSLVLNTGRRSPSPMQPIILTNPSTDNTQYYRSPSRTSGADGYYSPSSRPISGVGVSGSRFDDGFSQQPAKTYRHVHGSPSMGGGSGIHVDQERAISSDPYVLAFLEIDRDGNEVITAPELREYARTHHQHDTAFITRMMNNFMIEGDGKITLQEFCSAMAYDINKVREFRRRYYRRDARQLPEGVEVLQSDMNDAEKSDILYTMVNYLVHENERNSARHLKDYLDLKYGRAHHVFVMIGQFWAFYSHEPLCSFHFKVGRHLVLVFKTPEY